MGNPVKWYPCTCRLRQWQRSVDGSVEVLVKSGMSWGDAMKKVGGFHAVPCAVKLDRKCEACEKAGMYATPESEVKRGSSQAALDNSNKDGSDGR